MKESLGPVREGRCSLGRVIYVIIIMRIYNNNIRKNPVKCVSLRGSIRRFVLYEVEQVFKLTINAILNWLLSYSW